MAFRDVAEGPPLPDCVSKPWPIWAGAWHFEGSTVPKTVWEWNTLIRTEG